MKDIYQTITDRILASVDEAGNWKPCWHGFTSGRPVNAVTGHAYRGVNILTCWMEAQFKDYPSQRWASYKQWQSIGAQVRGGEKGTPIMFYKRIESSDPSDEENGRLFARTSWVFNAAQVDGDPGESEVQPQLSEAERIVGCEQWLGERLHAFTLTHSPENRAYYQPSTDSINMPSFALFHDAEHYYSTLFHELTHWTGAKHRLDREFRRDRESYAKEELVAELGAAFLCAQHGIDTVTRDDHASYIKGWLKALKDDKRLIVRAASLASSAADYLEQLAMAEERDAA